MDKPLWIMTPGPTQIPLPVRQAMARPSMHHRDQAFIQAVLEVRAALKRLLYIDEDPDYEVVIMPSSGRGAMETALANCFCRGDRILSVSTGHFGEMFATMATCWGLDVRHLRFLDQAVDFDQVEAALAVDKSLRAILYTHVDTSNGLSNDLPAMGALAKKYDKLLIVDAVASLGCQPVRMKEWNLDMVVSASQKGMMCPAGLAIAAMGPRVWPAADRSDLPKYYFNLKEMRDYMLKGQTPASTPVALTLGLQTSLSMLMEEGQEQAFARHASQGQQIRQAAAGMGFALFPEGPDLCRSASVSTFRLPEGLIAADFVNHIRDNYQVLFAKGLGEAANYTFRIGHMGWFHREDAEKAIAVMKQARTDLGL